MKNLSISWKIFFVLILFLVIPLMAWFGYQQLEQRLENQATQNNEKLLKVYHGFLQKLLQEDKDFLQQLSLEKKTNQVLVEKRQGPVLIDGFADEWFPYQQVDLVTRNDTKASNIRLIEDEQFVYGLIEITDNQLVYRSGPYSNRSSDMLRLDLGYGYWLFQAIAPGRINVLREYGDGFKNLTSVMAVWQESPAGYTIEFRAPKALVGDRISAVLYDVDKPNSKGFDKKYQGVFTFTDFSYYPLSREKNSDWLLDNHLEQKRLTIVNKAGQPVYQIGNLLSSENKLFIAADTYRKATKLDNQFTREIYQSNMATEAVQSGEKDFITRAGEKLSENNFDVGLVILETSIYSEKIILNRIVWLIIALYGFFWLFIVILVLRQIKQYRNRINTLNRLTEQAYEEDAELVDFTDIEIHGNDEVNDLYNNLIYYNQRLEERREHQQRLLARLNHELRTPLAIIGSSLDNLELSELEPDDKSLLKNARSGLERLSLNFSRLSEANRLEDSIDKVKTDWFELNSLLKDLVASYSNTWPDMKFELALADTKVKIKGSEGLFAQMMDKIVSNAVDFSEKNKPIKIELSFDKSNLLLSVMNWGTVISKDKLKAVFNLMESSRNKQSSSQSNLGLGLYLARLIAKRHRAKIRAINLPKSDGVEIQVSWIKKNYVVS